MFEPYILGILWGIGRYVNEERYPYFLLRHRERYFLDVVRSVLNVPGEVFQGASRTAPQYRLKIFHFDVSKLESLGWQPRIGEQRNYPATVKHRGFLRAYIEIHSTIDALIMRRREKARVAPRLRIYGNRNFLEDVTKVLANETGVGIKRVQKATNISPGSGVLYYQSRKELQILYEYIYFTGVGHYHQGYYDKFTDLLQTIK